MHMPGMTPHDLRAIGNRLFGPRWQTQLARAIGVTPRTVRRWTKGDQRIPPLADFAIRQLAEKDRGAAAPE